ncbi:isochorismatase family protein [Hahella ganghwensis]|uniref:isochorismatase family protein n=1 Tax=Hahella ganghwensis TaxID=286420 RepID=UPI00037E3076|nr:isochorismatase family protein [Hahella ganghwensis]
MTARKLKGSASGIFAFKFADMENAMIIKNTSLLDAMNNGVKARRQKFAVIVIDEQGNQKPNNIEALTSTLAKAAHLNIPVYLVEIDAETRNKKLNPIVIQNDANPSVKTLKDLRVKGATVVKKPHISMFNAKASLDMKSEIQKNNIDSVVIMGTKTNQCVKVNAVGGYVDRLNKEYYEGLNKLCHVHTCDAILRDVSPATWKNEKNVFFYEKFA